jgi:adenylate cyclase
MAEARVERRLAAILAADVAGYSRLMGVDEEGTLAALKAYRRELIDPKIAEHRGRIVKTTGDGALVEFASVVDAARCAMEIQRAMAERNADIPEERRIEFRIGINVGDIIIDEGDIYGDGVNIAARVETLASPGAICLSENAYQQIKGKLALDVSDMGEQQLKNIAQPVRVYGVRLDGAPMRAALALSDKPSIAVLPFNNMSGHSEQEFFADGLTEDLITALSHWRSFSVIARNSTFAYKGKSPDVREVARHLGVNYVLEGSVRTSGERIRISAQLIEGESGNHVWAEKYDRKLEDFFDLQDELTQVIAAKVEPEFARAEQKRATQKQHANLASWEWYQRGVAALDTVTKEGNIRARKCFEHAIELDPTGSRAYAGMAYALFRYMFDGLAEPGEVDNAEIVEFAKRAVALDDADALGHHTLALSLLYISGAHDLSIAEAQRAVELNPNFSQAHVPLGNALSFVGKPKEGICHLELAIRLNPDDIRNHIYLTYLAEAHLNNRDYEQSAACARKALQRKSNYAYSYFVLASALGHLGEIAASGEAVAECLRIQPGYIDIQRKIHRYRDPADRQHIEDGLRKGGWKG